MQQPLAPGLWVRLKSQADRGLGQVQSAVGHRVTVNFEHCGKQTIDIRKATLEPVRQEELGQ